MTQPTGGSTTEQVKDQVKDAARATEERARSAADQARRGLRDQVDVRSTQAGERVSGQAGDVRSVAEELRRQGKDGPARLADQLADRAEQLADYLKRADGDRILRDAEDYARRNPWAVAAGGLVLGFAASRFLKASSSQRYRASVGQPSGTARFDEPWRTDATSGGPAAYATEPPVTYSEPPATYTEPPVTYTTEPPVAGTTTEPGVAEPVGRPAEPTDTDVWPPAERPYADPDAGR
jgi:hypothetical protein